MSAAAKHTVLAAASLATVIAVSLVGTAGGASNGKTDRTAPTSPGNPHVTAATPSRVSVGWDPAQDNVAVAGYYVYGDTGRVTVAGTSYTVTSLGCGESTSLSVAAFDSSGNRSPKASTTVSTAACPDTQPPSPPSGFSQDATTQTGVVLSWSPSLDNVGVVEYGVYRFWTRVTSTAQSTVTLTGLACGTTYSYGVDAVDGAGNRSMVATAYVQTASCADDQPPSAPTSLAVSARTGTSISSTWDPSTDNVGVAGYRVSVNGSPSATVTQAAATVGSLACGTTYTIGVDAFDAAGNRSSATTISATTDVCAQVATDTTPPSTPTGLSASSVSQTGMNLSWNASTDNVAVTGYDVYRNGAKVATTSATASTQSGLACDSSYSFSVVARDAAGNSSPGAQLSASTSACSAPADTTPPSQPANLTIAGATATSVTLSWSASTDNVGVAGYRLYVNGAGGQTTTTPGITATSLTCGTAYTFGVDAYDAAGNRSAKATVIGSTSACVDTQAPSAPSNLVVSSRTATSVALSWTASTDNVGVTGYGLYRGSSSAGTSGTTSGIFSGLTCNTSYTLSVDAYDAGGNRSGKTSTLVSTSACPDTTPPSAPTGLAASNVTSSSLTLSWNASSDNVGVTGYDVLRDGQKMATVSSTSSSQSGLACGTQYTFAVSALDAAGNTSPQAQVSASSAACPSISSAPGGRLWSADSPINTPIPSNPQVMLGYGQGAFSGLPGIGFNGGGWGVGVFRDTSGARRTVVNPDGWKLDNVPAPAQLDDYVNAMAALGDTEHHAVIIDGDRVHNLYGANASLTTAGAFGELRSAGSAFWDNNLGPWLGRASGFSSATGAVLKSELDAGVIDHALAVGWPKDRISASAVPPATTSDGGAGSGGVPMGSRIQLDPTLSDADLLALGISSYYLPVARAMQKYGTFVADSTSWMTIYAESWNDGGRVSWPSGWYPGSTALVRHLRIVAPTSAPAYDSRLVFGQPYR